MGVRVPRKADVLAVVKLLESPAEDVEELAEQIIEAMDTARRDRTRFALAVQGLPVAYLYGDFENREEAIRWAKRVGLDASGLSVGVVPLFNRDSVVARHQKMTDDLAAKSTPEPIKRASAGRSKRAVA